MAKLLLFICFIIAIFSAFKFQQFIDKRFEFTKHVEHHGDEKCFAVRGVHGAEDLTHWKNGIILTTNLDSLNLWKRADMNWRNGETSNPQNAQEGFIYVISGLSSMRQNNEIIKLQKIKTNNFPESVAFHPHGFGINRITDELFVVNHAYNNGGERVDVFFIREITNPQSDKSTNHLEEFSPIIELDYRRSMIFDEDKIGILNDVISISSDGDSFYVTKYLPFADELHGRPLTTSHRLRDMFYFMQPFGLKWTSLLLCSFSSNSCVSATNDAFLWNGITAEYSLISNRDDHDMHQSSFNDDLGKSTEVKYHSVVAYDFENGIHIFNVSNDGSLHLFKVISIPNYADNVEFDIANKKVWIGGMMQLYECFIRWNEEISIKKSRDQLETSCSIHASSIDLSSGEIVDHIVHDGSKLGAAASAIHISINKHDREENENFIIIGSFADDGIIICPIESI